MFDIVEFNRTDTDPRRFLLLCEAMFGAYIVHCLTRSPPFAGFRAHLAFAFAESASPHPRLASTITARYE